MAWLQVKLQIDPQIADMFEDFLLEAGALSVTFQDTQDQPIYEPDLGTTPLWSQTTISALFAASQDLAEVEAQLRHAHAHSGSDKPFPAFSAEILEDKDWEREWMQSYQPMQFGTRLWICPSWCEPPQPNAVNLMLDPGLAFGTGTHPTTELCLRWLDATDLTGKTVTDYGCGSGILGVAALLLGAQSVLAVDIDVQALQATGDNLARNKISSDKLSAYLPEQAPAHQSDILVANILSGPLIELAPALAERTLPGGLLALSGILEEQTHDIVDTYTQWFELDPVVTLDGWIRVTGRRR